MKTTIKMKMTPKTEENPKNEDNLKNEYNLKNEDNRENEHGSRQIFLQSRAMVFSALQYSFSSCFIWIIKIKFYLLVELH